MSKKNPKVDWYFAKNKKWEKEIKKLRTIALESGLEEELKWGCPCYMRGKSNIVLIHVFKEYCAYLFFKGVLMKDKHDILVQQTENVQSGRQIRFKNLQEIVKMKNILKAYIKEAIDLDKAGLKVNFKQTKEYKVPEEFQNYLDEMSELKTAFESLTPGRQRGYLLYFSQAKQSKTRESRIKKYLKHILDGKGLDD